MMTTMYWYIKWHHTTLTHHIVSVDSDSYQGHIYLYKHSYKLIGRILLHNISLRLKKWLEIIVRKQTIGTATQLLLISVKIIVHQMHGCEICYNCLKHAFILIVKCIKSPKNLKFPAQCSHFMFSHVPLLNITIEQRIINFSASKFDALQYCTQ